MSVVVRGAGLGTMYAVPTATSLRIVEEIPFNEWQRLAETVTAMGDRVAWWIGDVLAFGDRQFRGEYRAALEAMDRKWGAHRNYAWVSEAVGPATRVADLSWTHHRVVAKLTAEEQAQWLDAAVRGGWSHRELEATIASGAVSDRPVPVRALTIRTQAGLRDLFERAAERAGAESPAAWALVVLERAARVELGELEAA